MQIALRKNAVIILRRSDSASLRLDIFIHVHENFVLGACCNYCSALLHFKQWTKHILLHRSKGIKNKWFFEPRERMQYQKYRHCVLSAMTYLWKFVLSIFIQRSESIVAGVNMPFPPWWGLQAPDFISSYPSIHH